MEGHPEPSPGHRVSARSANELRALGERLYRTGIGTSGHPLKATVERDVDTSSAQSPCVACHGRSGLGQVEGPRVVVPVAAPFLSESVALRARPRPAYTDAQLGRAIREGVDSGGTRLDGLMPRYQLTKEDERALVAYLRHLSLKPSPGVEGNDIHFATVVAPGTSIPEREAMLGMLQAFFRDKTASAIDRRGRHLESWPEFYGNWVLHVWTLEGEPRTWRAQLEAEQRKRPVFALVSGIGREWGPVQGFCDAKELPCLLPNVDEPPASDTFYSRYFSSGTSIEADVIAAHLARTGKEPRVLQVIGADPRALRGATVLGAARPADAHDGRWVLRAKDLSKLSDATLSARIRESRATAAVLWLDRAELEHLTGQGIGVPLYVSATLSGEGWAQGRGLSAAKGYVVQPFAPQAEVEPRFRPVSSWLTRHRLTSTVVVRRVQDQTFFALTVLNEGFMHVKKNFIRDYLLEGIDHFSGFDTFSASYPHLSFGPGQQFLSKGCYLIPLDRSGKPDWVVP